jgi:4-amino-4-deoxy-L-arabinose transferase-like glycosyltransferase
MTAPPRGSGGLFRKIVLALETRRGRALFVGGLMRLALGRRVVFVLAMRANPTFDRPILDGEYHVQWARAIAAGQDFYALKHGHPGPYFRAPLYIWFLGAIFRFFGDGLLLPRLVQCSFGAVTTWLAYRIGKRAFDARVGLLAAAMAATYWVLIYFDGELLIETLVVPLDMLALWLTMGLANRRTPARAALAGLAWGVAAIARPNVIVYAPFVVLWLAWLARPRWKQALVPAAAFTPAFFAPILPITAINYFHGGDTVLIASQGGVNFWIGNNPNPTARPPSFPARAAAGGRATRTRSPWRSTTKVASCDPPRSRATTRRRRGRSCSANRRRLASSCCTSCGSSGSTTSSATTRTCTSSRIASAG